MRAGANSQTSSVRRREAAGYTEDQSDSPFAHKGCWWRTHLMLAHQVTCYPAQNFNVKCAVSPGIIRQITRGSSPLEISLSKSYNGCKQPQESIRTPSLILCAELAHKLHRRSTRTYRRRRSCFRRQAASLQRRFAAAARACRSRQSVSPAPTPSIGVSTLLARSRALDAQRVGESNMMSKPYYCLDTSCGKLS